MIRVQSTKYFKSPPELWGTLSPGHVLTSFKARLGSDLRQSFYFSPSVHSCSADSSRQDMGAREPGEFGLRLSLQHEKKHGSGEAMQSLSHRKFPTTEMRGDKSDSDCQGFIQQSLSTSRCWQYWGNKKPPTAPQTASGAACEVV